MLLCSTRCSKFMMRKWSWLAMTSTKDMPYLVEFERCTAIWTPNYPTQKTPYVRQDIAHISLILCLLLSPPISTECCHHLHHYWIFLLFDHGKLLDIDIINTQLQTLIPLQIDSNIYKRRRQDIRYRYQTTKYNEIVTTNLTINNHCNLCFPCTTFNN